MSRPFVPFSLGRSTLAVALVLGATCASAADVAGTSSGVDSTLAATTSSEPNAVAGALAGEAAETLTPPRWVASVDASSRDYRWSLSRGELDIGMTFDAAKPRGVALGLDPRPDLATAPVGDALPALSVGLRREATGDRVASSTLLQRVSGVAMTDGYVSKLGVQWKPAQSQVNFLREGLGFRLDGNDRMTVRLRKGVLGIYMLRKF